MVDAEVDQVVYDAADGAMPLYGYPCQYSPTGVCPDKGNVLACARSKTHCIVPEKEAH